MVLDDEDLHVKKLFETNKELQKAMYWMSLKHNFEFEVNKSNKSLLTIVCVDHNCCWRLQGTKIDTNELFVVCKYARECTHELKICHNDHRQVQAWFISRQIMHKYQDAQMIYRHSYIINDIYREYIVIMSYQKA